MLRGGSLRITKIFVLSSPKVSPFRFTGRYRGYGLDGFSGLKKKRNIHEAAILGDRGNIIQREFPECDSESWGRGGEDKQYRHKAGVFLSHIMRFIRQIIFGRPPPSF